MSMNTLNKGSRSPTLPFNHNKSPFIKISSDTENDTERLTNVGFAGFDATPGNDSAGASGLNMGQTID